MKIDIKGREVTIDDEDAPLLEGYTWRIAGKDRLVYVVTQRKRKAVYLHRLIMGIVESDSKMVIDHINGDGLDNRKCNLRVCDHAHNMRNRNTHKGGSSQFKGVFQPTGIDKWYASIRLNGKQKHLGCFTSEIQAAEAYNEAALKYHGEFARLNIIPHHEQR